MKVTKKEREAIRDYILDYYEDDQAHNVRITADGRVTTTVIDKWGDSIRMYAGHASELLRQIENTKEI